MNLLVVDDHALIREALRGVLKELMPDATIVEASNWRQAARDLESEAPGLVLLDLHLPDRDGFGALAELRDRYPEISVVVLSGTEDATTIAKALDLGALGFIPKSASREVMLGALNLVLSGGMYIPPQILGRHATDARDASKAHGVVLTDRQRAVLALMMQGRSNKAICRTLDLAEPTVKNHVTAILKALHASNRTEAVVTARNLGLTEDG